MAVSPIARQLLVASSTQLAALSVGGVVCYPAVLLQQLRSNGTTIALDFDTASWIGSINGLAGIPSILMPTIMQWKGRKFAFIAASLIIITGWIISYSASSALSLLISESFHGLGTNSILAVSLLSMSEMVTPKYRNISMLSFSIVQALGMCLVGIMAGYVHWQNISIIMCIPMILALATACMWPESPSWLAYKGELQKCQEAFTWLRGTDDKSTKELEELININSQMNKKRHGISFKALWRKILRRDFYLPSLHMFVLLNLMYWSGSMVILIYSSQLIEKVTQSSFAAKYGCIAISCMFFTCLTITGGLIRRFKHKSVLLTSTFFTIVSLISACIVTFLQSRGILQRDSLICLYSLLGYIVCCSLGMNSIVFTISAELMPVKHRGLGGALFVIYTCVLHTSSLKLSPYMFEYIDVWGTFLVYTLNAVICGFIIWRYVPETKGRTLQEIEEFYIYGNFDRTDRLDDVNKSIING